MQRGVGEHVHLSTKGVLQIQFQPHKVEQALGVRKSHQEVKIAFLGCFATGNRAKNGRLRNIVPLKEGQAAFT